MCFYKCGLCRVCFVQATNMNVNNAQDAQVKLRLNLGERAYTFYGFSYFFRRQTLKRGGGQGNGVKERRHTQPPANKHPKEQKNISWVILLKHFKCLEDARSPSGLSHIMKKYDMSPTDIHVGKG